MDVGLDVPFTSNLFGYKDEVDKIKVVELYKKPLQSNLTILNFANWSSVSGLEISQLEKWERRRDLSSAKIAVTSTTVR